MELKKIVATNVRQLRKAHNMTQAQLAENLELSLDMVGRIERGIVAPSFNTLEALCRVFGIDSAGLFSIDVPAKLKTERAVLLNGVNSLLSRMSDKDIRQAKKLLEALN